MKPSRARQLTDAADRAHRAEQVAMHAALADLDRADRDRFLTLAAVPDHERPVLEGVPADISKLDPETVWPTLPRSTLLFLASLADDGACHHDAEITRLLHQEKP